jgi:hypothetical protein
MATLSNDSLRTIDERERRIRHQFNGTARVANADGLAAFINEYLSPLCYAQAREARHHEAIKIRLWVRAFKPVSWKGCLATRRAWIESLSRAWPA